ncbi:triose-phosphate isomerase [Candidatus Berkelbacteria bacterium]|nr:triose-phosphate isomerase [Candidatus Berkelbacteria bacterium]
MPKRTPLVVGNWKMHTSFADAIVLATQIKHHAESLSGVEVVICPPFLWLYPLAETLQHASPRHLSLGAQNVSEHDNGALTGEVSAAMLQHLVRYVIVGHSERLAHFGETAQTTNAKIHAALRHHIKPIVCVGELTRSRNPEKEVLHRLREILEGVTKHELEELVLVYEPVWAISSHGEPPVGRASPDGGSSAEGIRVQLVAQAIHETISDVPRVLYGGSVTALNTLEFMSQADIDGVLVGAASLKASEFIKICKLAAYQ